MDSACLLCSNKSVYFGPEIIVLCSNKLVYFGHEIIDMSFHIQPCSQIQQYPVSAFARAKISNRFLTAQIH